MKDRTRGRNRLEEKELIVDCNRRDRRDSGKTKALALPRKQKAQCIKPYYVRDKRNSWSYAIGNFFYLPNVKEQAPTSYCTKPSVILFHLRNPASLSQIVTAA